MHWLLCAINRNNNSLFVCKTSGTELFVSTHYWAEVTETICFGKVNPGASLCAFFAVCNRIAKKIF